VILGSIEDVAALVDRPGRTLVGIAGSPGAGKSTVAERLVARLPSAALLPMDGFHLPQVQLRRLGRRERMGAPDTFDIDGFVAALASVRSARGPVAVPGFDRDVEEPVPGAITIETSVRVVVVEGNYLLLESGGWEAIAPLLDVTFFVSVDHGIRIDRLVARHERFGKRPADARAWALGPDESNARIIEPTSARADHLIDLKVDSAPSTDR
jgi:pantothenate kinase